MQFNTNLFEIFHEKILKPKFVLKSALKKIYFSDFINQVLIEIIRHFCTK